MSFFSRLRNAIRPKRLDDELLNEMADHVERRAAALRENGLSAEQARQQAERRFGNVTQLREQSREIRLSAILENTFQDLRYAMRGMRRSPAFAVTAILSLALAIGANTAIYSIVDAALLRPLPVPQPERLFTLATPSIQGPGDEPGEDISFSYPLYQDLRAAAGDSARLALFNGGGAVEVQIPSPDAPIEKAIREFVSGDAFEIVQVPPALGRVFSSQDDKVPGGHPVAVISHDYWRRRFHSDPQVLNQRLLIAGKQYSIVGVAREGFFGDEPGKFVDIWIPSMMANKEALAHRGWAWFHIVGRLSPGVTGAQLQPRLQTVYRSDSEEKVKRIPTMPPAIRKQFLDRPLLVHSAAAGVSNFRKNFARPLWIVLGVAAGILLIACANVASLLLARSTARASEMAMRVSLGAGRSRLVRQLLTESLLLSAIAGVLGWALAQVAAPALVAALSTADDPVRFALAPGFFPGDTRVLFFCAAVSTAAAVFFGLLPAWQASGAQPMRELHGLRVASGRLRLGRFFVATQVAFAFCLIIGGAAFLFSLRNLFKVDTGFNPHNIAILDVRTNLDDKTQKSQCNALLDEIQRRIGALPGIQSVTAVRWSLFEGRFATNQVLLPGKPPSEREEIFYSISSNYFATLRTPLLTGRDFTPRDRDIPDPPPAGQSVPAIVNQAFAQRYFGTENPLGKTFQSPYNDHVRVTYEVVGVAANSHYVSLRNGPDALIYVPALGVGYFTLYIRSPLDLGSVIKVVDREAQAIGHETRVYEMTTLDTLIGNTLLKEKLLAGIGGVFAFLGLLLAAIGLFGLLNYSVTLRTKEIGIRAALGARPPSLVYLILKDMFSMIAGGLVIGMAASLTLMTFVRSLLFGIRPVDPLVITTAAAVFLLAALIAGGLPASRAAGIDPMVALRHE